MRKAPFFRSCVIMCAILSPFMIALEPVPPPYHQFVLRGTVVRFSNGPRSFFVVTLAGKFNGFSSGSTGDLSGDYVYVQGDRTQGITDSTGAFYIQVSLGRKPDSLAIKVEAADKLTYVGNYFKTPEASSEINDTIEESEPGCSGCSRNPVAATRVLGYRYTIETQLVVLPY